MSIIQQYQTRLTKVLTSSLSINENDIHGRLGPRSIRSITVTNPNYLDFLNQTYSFTSKQFDSVYRFGIGHKLSKSDSYDIYDEFEGLIERPEIDECGILCPRGILTFYEDVLCESRKAYILAASYHFQTMPLSDPGPLYIRFEFDPLATSNRDFERKSVFHYHFSNYDLFEKCHFPAGCFEVENFYIFSDPESKKYFSDIPDTINLERFLHLLIEAKLIGER